MRGGARAGSGRKPKPTALKVLQGNPGKRALNDKEPKPRLGLPSCPDHLEGEARKEWFRLGKKLAALGLLTEIDKAALAIYCQSWGRWVNAEQDIARNGVLLDTPDGLKPSPMLGIANRAMDTVLKILGEFGMTPSSRSRLKVDMPQQEEDPLERLRNRGFTNRPT